MIKKLLFSMGLSMLFGSQLMAQKVPYSDHVSDQLLQGPCYIFATVAAMESKALQAQGYMQDGHSGADFNEWRYWSDCVLGGADGNPDHSLTQLVSLPLEHMINHGTVQASSAFNFVSPSQLPNYNPNDCGPFNGLASFGCTNAGPLGTVSNFNWCESFGGYKKSSAGDCPEDIFGSETFDFSQALGNPDFSFSNLTVHHINGNISDQLVIDQLAAGNGVVAVIDNYGIGTCAGVSSGIQHAIFIYEHTNGNFYFKDSWPGSASKRKHMSVSQFNDHQVRKLTYVSGNAVCNNCPTDDPCDFSISGSGTIGCSNTTYQLTGGTGNATNISWQFPPGVTIVSGANSSTVTVRSDNNGTPFSGQIQVSYSDVNNSCTETKSVTVCADATSDHSCDFYISGPGMIGCNIATYQLTGGTGSATNISWQVPFGVSVIGGINGTTLLVQADNCNNSFNGNISVSYTDVNGSCSDSELITVSGGNVMQPTGIQLNGPASGQISDVCPGSAAQLMAIDNNSGECPIYEWFVSGATILNGHGTNTINIQTNNIDGAYQYYRVRVRKSCGSFTAWTTRTGYLDDCSGGGIGIFPPGFGLAQTLGSDEIFSSHPSLQELKVQIISLSGQKLKEFRIVKNQHAMDLSNLPAGILVARFFDLDKNLLDIRKISIIR